MPSMNKNLRDISYLPPPKIYLKPFGFSTISELIPDLVRADRKHILEQPEPVVFTGASTITSSLVSNLSFIANWHYIKAQGYASIVTPEVAREVGFKLQQTYGNTSFNDLDPAEFEFTVRPSNDIEELVVDTWAKTLASYRANYEHATSSEHAQIMRSDIQAVMRATARANEGLETWVTSEYPEINELVNQLAEKYPLHSLRSLPPSEFYAPALRSNGALLIPPFAEDMQAIRGGEYGIFADTEVVPGITMPIGIKFSDKPVDNESYFSVPVIVYDENHAGLSFEILENSKFVIKKESNGLVFLYSLGKLKLDEQDILTDSGHLYMPIKFRDYITDSGLRISSKEGALIKGYLRSTGFDIETPVLFTNIDELSRRELPEFAQRLEALTQLR
jgi:hypothetical protein